MRSRRPDGVVVFERMVTCWYCSLDNEDAASTCSACGKILRRNQYKPLPPKLPPLPENEVSRSRSVCNIPPAKSAADVRSSGLIRVGISIPLLLLAVWWGGRIAIVGFGVGGINLFIGLADLILGQHVLQLAKTPAKPGRWRQNLIVFLLLLVVVPFCIWIYVAITLGDIFWFR